MMEMSVPTAVRTFMVGKKCDGNRYYVRMALAIGIFVISAGAYTVGIFEVSSGVVFVPEYAALFGVVVAGWTGYRRDGLLTGWLFAYASLLGYHASRSVAANSTSLSDGLTYFVRIDGLSYLAVAGIVVGLPAFLAGYGIQRGLRYWNGRRLADG